MQTEDKPFDVVIIGAGIVGLATAREILRTHPRLSVVILEKEAEVASHQSGRNSGVIHSGIYYKPGSLKARLCVAGAASMLRFCREEGLPHAVCGKLIVATTPSELDALEELLRRAVENGVSGVTKVSADQARDLEPNVSAVAGVHVRGTAITDFRLVAGRLAELIVAAGGIVRRGVRVTGFSNHSSETIVETNAAEVRAKTVINCAGLHSDRIAALAGVRLPIKIIPFRGEYYCLRPERQDLVGSLLYPVPDPRFPFLGVHFTKRIGGGVDAGPNAVLALKREGYTRTAIDRRDVFEMARFDGFWRMASKYWDVGIEEFTRSVFKSAFVRALQRLVPAIEERDLQPAGAGVRAQAVTDRGAFVEDFYFAFSERAIHVCNVPSPAATACFEIAKRIVSELSRNVRPESRGA